jgi:hypothetical protein
VHLTLRNHRGAAAVCALVFVAAACGGGKKGASTPTSKPEASPSTTVAAPALCPLTGAPSGGTNTARPALAIKIDNAPPARPQAGLDSADIVYEELAEGGITRFVALFHCRDAGRVGPVRSARLVDPDLLIQYKPILFGYSGANPTVLTKVKGTQGIVSVEHGSNGPAYERVRGRPAPHNLFTSTAKLYSRASTVQGAPQTTLAFEAVSPTGSSASPTAAAAPAPAKGPGNSVTFSFKGAADHRYTYDAASSSYLRFQGVNQAFNVEGAGQAKAVNLVFQKVKPISGALVDFQVVGSGEAIVMSGGASVKGTWSRPNTNDVTKFLDAAGNPIKLRPGNTWIHLIPEGQAIAPS